MTTHFVARSMNEKEISNPPKVLIVDDEELNRNLLESMMELIDYQSVCVGSGPEALDMLAEQSFDLVLLDVMMPGMDGLETATIIRKKFSPSDLPIIMVTALASKNDRLKAVKAGDNDFVSKPVDRIELHIRSESQVKIKRMQDEIKAHQANLENLVQDRTKELRNALAETEKAREKILFAHRDTIHRLGVAAEFKDEDTADHIFRMSNYCKVIATGLKLSEDEIDAIYHASPMHDVGKIGIPDAILFKPGKLDENEWVIMKEHTSIGYRILGESDSRLLQAGSVIAMTHHEKWDGTGYPAGLAGEDIPISGRSCAVADVFDALTSKRPYKEPFSEEKTLAIMAEGRGSHFDPEVLDIFMKNLDEIRFIKSKYQRKPQGIFDLIHGYTPG